MHVTAVDYISQCAKILQAHSSQPVSACRPRNHLYCFTPYSLADLSRPLDPLTASTGGRSVTTTAHHAAPSGMTSPVRLFFL